MNEPFLTSRLADFLSWRNRLEGQIDSLRRALTRHELFDEDCRTKLDALLSRLYDERLTMAFVAEAGRGKSELINAMFSSERGLRMLPSGDGLTTLCVTELRHDRGVPTCVRLLPIETREMPKRISELEEDSALWEFVLFEYEDSESISEALRTLSETRRVTVREAVAWGLHRDTAPKTSYGYDAYVNVPRWRHAIINFPHPLLQAGLVVLDTPGLAALAAEPDLSRQRIPEADCVVFVLDATEGVSKADLAIWRDYLSPASPRFASISARPTEAPQTNRLVVLNKIDSLHGDAGEDENVLHAIDELRRSAAELLKVDPIKVVPLSARMGFEARIAGDRDQLIRSRVYQLERAIADELGSERQTAVSLQAYRTLSDMVARARARLDETRYRLLEQLRLLTSLREKNLRLMDSVLQNAAGDRGRLDAAFREMRAVRGVHARLVEEIALVVDPEPARKRGRDAAKAITKGVLSEGIITVLERYIEESARHISAIETKINEIKGMFGEICRDMKSNYGIVVAEVLPFPTQRFHSELQKIRSDAQKEFARMSNVLLRRGNALAQQFDELVAVRTVRIFEIASRETQAWVRGLMAGLEKPFDKVRASASQRSGSMEKLHNAELDLAEKISELQAQLDIVRSRHDAIADADDALERHFEFTERKTAAQNT